MCAGEGDGVCVDMASSSRQGRRPWPSASEASCWRMKRARYPPPSSPVTPSYPPSSTLLSYSPTSPSYSPRTYVSYPPTSPLNNSPRYGDDVIGDQEPGSDGQEDENYDEEEQQQLREQEYSDGSDEDDPHAHEEEWRPRCRRHLHDEEEYSEGSDGENGVEDEQHGEEGEEPPHDEEQWRSESEREQEHPADRSDGENGVEEDEQQPAGEQQAGEAPQPHAEDDGAAGVDGDLAAMPPPRPPSPALSSLSESSIVGEMTVDRTDALDCGICFLPLKPPILQLQ